MDERVDGNRLGNTASERYLGCEGRTSDQSVCGIRVSERTRRGYEGSDERRHEGLGQGREDQESRISKRGNLPSCNETSSDGPPHSLCPGTAQKMTVKTATMTAERKVTQSARPKRSLRT